MLMRRLYPEPAPYVDVADAYTVRLELDAGDGEEVGWSRLWYRRIERELQ